MTPDPDNPGWFYIFLPADITGIIINEGVDGGAQTHDMSFAGSPIWITVTDNLNDNDQHNVEISESQQTSGSVRTQDPFVFGETEELVIDEENSILVRAVVPEEWASPGVWAWNDGDGLGDVFVGWPGRAFDEMDGVWHVMRLPNWIDHIIINGHQGGGIRQTDDIELEPGRDIWIVVVDEFGGFDMRYEAFNPADAQAEVVERTGPVAITADPTPTPAATPTPPPAPQNDGPNVVLIIVIVSTVVAVLLAGAFLLLKKKK
jgi:hypothetical protein